MAKKFEFGTSNGAIDGAGNDFDFDAIARDPDSLGAIGDDSGNGDVDGSGAGSGDGRTKRGRKPRDPNAPKPERKPRGSNRPDAATYKANITALAGMLQMVHMGLSGVTQMPELALNDIEATTLSSAANEMMVQFNIAPDPKVQAVFGMIVAASMVYGPKVLQIRQRSKASTKEPKNKLGLHVVNETA